MKVTKIPGLGRFGVFIDDLDLNTVSKEEWMEIGQLHLETLVTIFRNVNIDYPRYWELISMWGPSRYSRPANIYNKYGKSIKELMFNGELEEPDLQAVQNARRWQVDRRCDGVVRVTAKKDALGRSMGVFGDGELKWHSNECGDIMFTPGVSLLGWESMKDSCTGFLTTTDWYEAQSESFRSELDEMVIIHNYSPGRINPVAIDDQESFYRDNNCPIPNSRIPLVIQSPGGIRGLHIGINTFDQIEGMSAEDSKKFLTRLEKELFVPEYTYEHWYQQDNDLLLFDNSIVLHNRQIKDNGTSPNRVGLRIQFDYDGLTDGDYLPYYQDEFNQQRLDRISLLRHAMS